MRVTKRRARIWTWDRGRRPVDMDGPPELLAPILETVLEGCLWEELDRFPPEVVERLLPRVNIPRNIRRLVEIWIEESTSRSWVRERAYCSGGARQ